MRRTEITINDGDDNTTNAGRHPHYHTILIVPKDKLQQLSDVEQQWRDAWADAVCKHYEKIVGEKIDKFYIPAFRLHGLILLAKKNQGKKFARAAFGFANDNIAEFDNLSEVANFAKFFLKSSIRLQCSKTFNPS